MKHITRREALAAGAAGVALAAGVAARAEAPKAAETKPSSTSRVGGLIYQLYGPIGDIPRGGKLFTAVIGQPIAANSVVASVASFDVRYTTGGGYKVQGVRAGATITQVFPSDGKAEIRCVCEIYDDDGDHDSRGQMFVVVMAQGA
jgi:hypothetical protein